MQKEKILVVEDDGELSGIITRFLRKEGYEVERAFTGDEGIRLAKSFQPTMILLDLMLPGVDGFEVCREIRTHSLAPIMIISAKHDDMDKMLSLGIGADDYLEKPFSLLELQARVKSHIRRYTMFSKQEEKEEDFLKVYGDIKVDTRAHRVLIRGEREVRFTTREFELLVFFISHPSQVFSKEQLLDQVWGNSDFVDLNTITVYVGRIREKLMKELGRGKEKPESACPLKTVWGAGYKWE